MSIEDAECSKPSKRVTIPKIVEKVYDVVLYDQRGEVEEFTKTVSMSMEPVHHNLHGLNSFNKIFHMISN